ncbi:3-oxoacyl-ACP reductase family protein [Halocella sp. SP3-1]|uniref:SDR family NAD(P)-dependent oxidoreductase n=1 Tax=Halocella sp. SP3-1 TaxID=2382161 RepID=UPI000F7530FC|nr:3-oxoacyl-ACP reductase family protein [Halocella sp. SP3-1]AZO96589.1 3-oxoacyl-ACP reductase FabG [Halocella sp. SP3-1]
MFELTDKVAIVTGAGSKRGIGRSIVLGLAEQGAKVVVCDVDFDGAKAVAEEVEKKGVESLAVKVDVINEEDINQLVEKTIKKFGKIDILVNNAGITQPVKVLDTTAEDWDRIMDVNLKGSFLCTKAVLPSMLEQKYGRVINVSSVSGKRGGGVFGGAHYSASKAGMLAFAKALSREVCPRGITVNSVAPGLVATDIRGGVESQEKQKEMTADIPCRRMGKPEEIAATVCFLASKEAGYITGEDIDINGGSHMD